MITLLLTSPLGQWVRRLAGWNHGDPTALEAVDESPTVGDYIERREIGSRLPVGWRVERDIVQFRGESLAEVARLTNSQDGYRITLKPVEMLAPTDRIEIYTRRSPFGSRRRRATVDSLSAACSLAVDIAADRSYRVNQPTSSAVGTLLQHD